MKKVALMVFVVLFFLVSAISTYAKEIKAAYVDLDKVFGDYNKTKEKYKSLDEKLKEKESERKKLVDEIRRLKDELDLLSDKGKEEKQAVIDEKMNALSDFDRKAKNEFRKERMSAIRDISNEIDLVIQDYGKTQGYDYIFSSRSLVYSKDEYNITDEIIKILNSKTTGQGGKRQ